MKDEYSCCGLCMSIKYAGWQNKPLMSQFANNIDVKANVNVNMRKDSIVRHQAASRHISQDVAEQTPLPIYTVLKVPW